MGSVSAFFCYAIENLIGKKFIAGSLDFCTAYHLRLKKTKV